LFYTSYENAESEGYDPYTMIGFSSYDQNQMKKFVGVPRTDMRNQAMNACAVANKLNTNFGIQSIIKDIFLLHPESRKIKKAEALVHDAKKYSLVGVWINNDGTMTVLNIMNKDFKEPISIMINDVSIDTQGPVDEAYDKIVSLLPNVCG